MNLFKIGLFLVSQDFVHLFSLVSLKFQGHLSFKMPISRKKMILLLGIVFLEQGTSATVPLPKGKLQKSSITTYLCLKELPLLATPLHIPLGK